MTLAATPSLELPPALLAALGSSAAKGALLLALAWLATVVVTRRASAAVRHLVWTVALASALLLPVLSAALPAWRALPRLGALARADARRVAAVSEIAARAEAEPGRESANAAPPAEPAGTLSTPARRGGPPASQSASQLGIDHHRSVASDDDPPRTVPVDVWLLAVWAAGAVVVLARLAVAMARLRAAARRAVADGPREWQLVADQLAARLGIVRPVRVRWLDGDCVPMTWGVFRPALLLPVAAAGWSHQRRRAVLLHELAHVARHDAATQLVAQLACALFWFDPLVWLAARAMRREREHACDDLVLAAGARPSEYASDLLDIVRAYRAPRATSAAAFAMARRTEFEGRVLAILDPSTQRAGVTRWRASAVSAVAIAFALPLSALAPASRAGATPRASEVRRPRPPAASVEPRTIALAPTVGQGRRPGASVAPIDAPSEPVAGAQTLATAAPDTNPPAAPDRETLVAVAREAARIQSDHEKGELLRTIAVHYQRDAALRTAFLAAVATMTSDYEKTQTLAPWLSRDSLPAEATAQALGVAAGMTSDYERRRLLLGLVEHGTMASDAVRAALYDALGRMTSDFERAAVLRAIVRRPASAADLVDALRAAAKMSSGTDKAGVLVELARAHGVADPSVRRAYLDAAQTLTVDAEYRRVLRAAALP